MALSERAKARIGISLDCTVTALLGGSSLLYAADGKLFEAFALAACAVTSAVGVRNAIHTARGDASRLQPDANSARGGADKRARGGKDKPPTAEA